MNTVATPINYGARMPGGPQYSHQQLQTPTRGIAQGTPHVQPNRRGPGPMVTHQQSGHPPMSQAQIQHQQAQARAYEIEQAKRRARKPTDKTISPAIGDIAPLTTSYNDLRLSERRLDAVLTRRRLDVQDAVTKNTKSSRILRLYISNAASSQAWQEQNVLDDTPFDFDTGVIPSHRIKIEGCLIEDDNTPRSDSPETPPGKSAADGIKAHNAESGSSLKKEDGKPPKRFSQFFRKIHVELHRSSIESSYGETNIVEWQRANPAPSSKAAASTSTSQPQEFDGFEFERKLEINTPCTITLVRDEQPERFKLSRDLQNLLDTAEDTRAGVMLGIWEYALTNNLQERDDRRSILCDEKLKKVFQQDKISIPKVPDLVAPHLEPIDPITLKYMIKVDSTAPAPVIYDIMVAEEDPLRLRMRSLINSQLTSPSIRNLVMEDDNIAVLVQAINHSKAKRDFWTSLGTDPASFIQQWVSSQKRDLEVILGEKGVDNEESRRADFYQRPIVSDNVYLLAHGKETVVPGMR